MTAGCPPACESMLAGCLQEVVGSGALCLHPPHLLRSSLKDLHGKHGNRQEEPLRCLLQSTIIQKQMTTNCQCAPAIQPSYPLTSKEQSSPHTP